MTGLLDYYLGPTGIPDRLRAVGQVLDYLNPVNAIGSSMQASQRLFAPETSGWGRVQATGDMLSGMAGAVAPGAVASRAGVPAANALQEGLMGFAMNPAPRMVADDVGRFFVDESGAIRVWHGSPHDFDRFSMDKIGTGEGAQAYGHGLYFAENRDVAEGYRRDLATQFSVQGKPIVTNNRRVGTTGDADIDDLLAATNGNLDQAIAEQAAYVAQLGNVPYAEAERGILGRLEALRGQVSAQNTGRLYEVEIDANPEDFLDWDAPLSAQPEVWRRIARGWGGEAEAAERLGLNPDVATGRQYLDAIAPQGRGAAFAGASQRMAEEGIPGIRYLDAGSRGAGDGSRNYVVFDDRLISILNKYGLPLGIVGAGNYMMPQDNRQGGL